MNPMNPFLPCLHFSIDVYNTEGPLEQRDTDMAHTLQPSLESNMIYLYMNLQIQVVLSSTEFKCEYVWVYAFMLLPLCVYLAF